MSASTEKLSRSGCGRRAGGGLAAAIWQPAGVIYLAVLLVAMAAGLWHEAIYPPREALQPAPLPTLQTLAVGQVAFFLLIYPLILLRRISRQPIRHKWARRVIETAGLFAVTVPFYLAAAYLADAVASDVVRVAIYMACLVPLSCVAGSLLARARVAPVVLLGMLIVAMGLPAACYLAREFFAARPGFWGWQLCPASFAWELARARGGQCLPSPAWAVLVWPGVAAGAALLGALLGHNRQDESP